ncbi:hypothetical protein FH972_005656 [Carpinus fangiana]|uniref:Leucine-rich repeat-containing N-terminal plant-type domain-containing protein n=1 Tax=Carpinus fangiana TaxID=176857 RepID=A0A5N6QPX3_9ROSI|nr:hypothetical protein FH972_005656 [Carpinus fangiana]
MLVLTLNFHDEEMPDNLNLQFKNLKALVLANCKLRGSVPRWLSGCSMLDLSWNHLGGTIPSWIGEFESLFYLDLSNNFFNDEIPKRLTELQTLISGNISVEEPVLCFQLHKGNGHGFGNLRRLHVFTLKDNNLSEPILDNLSGMPSLEVLDLSHNKLLGEIPHSFANLSFLSAFNESYNQMCGEIPQAVQFNTFPDTSFVGNIRLCRAQCTCDSEQTPTHSFKGTR